MEEPVAERELLRNGGKRKLGGAIVSHRQTQCIADDDEPIHPAAVDLGLLLIEPVHEIAGRQRRAQECSNHGVASATSSEEVSVRYLIKHPGACYRRTSPTIDQGKHDDSRHNHDRTEQLSHAEGSEDESELDVRLSCELDEK